MEALKNCQHLNVIYREQSEEIEQCTAVVPQYESYYLHKYLRVSENSSDPKFETVSNDTTSPFPLRFVSRFHQLTGLPSYSMEPADYDIAVQSWAIISKYRANLDDLLADLKPILERIAINNTVVVMVANFGHAELLMNFVCVARTRSLNISNVLVVTTDEAMLDIANDLGVATYFDRVSNSSGRAAEEYGDEEYTAMMIAKVLCVIGPSMLGYNVLFQDVDIVWYANPLEVFFHNESLRPVLDQFDVLFQDDGARNIRFAPWSANSGFYYVRNNAVTKHFLMSMLGTISLALQACSHQQALSAVMSKHASSFGLRIKVLNRDMDEFPGGWHYNHESDDYEYMRGLFNGTKRPIIFHMSWTNNKENKVKFFQQMGEWHVQPSCVGKKREEISHVIADCCSSTPQFSCHYSDKPSVRPCSDSPALNNETESRFWI
jgi:Nucleotide-diphospho-sugar transferase